MSMSPVKTTTRLFLGKCCSVCRSQCSSLAGGANVVTGGVSCPAGPFSPSPFTEGAGVGVVASLVMASADLLLVILNVGIAMQLAGRCCDESVYDACEVKARQCCYQSRQGGQGSGNAGALSMRFLSTTRADGAPSHGPCSASTRWIARAER